MSRAYSFFRGVFCGYDLAMKTDRKNPPRGLLRGVFVDGKLVAVSGRVVRGKVWARIKARAERQRLIRSPAEFAEAIFHTHN